MKLHDNIGGFQPYDMLFWLPWWATGIAFYIAAIGAVMVATWVDGRRFVWDEQWSSFVYGFIGLAVSITSLCYIFRDTDQSWRWWIGWVIFGIAFAIRVKLTDEEQFRHRHPLTLPELNSYDKKVFDRFSFTLAVYGVTVSWATSIIDVDLTDADWLIPALIAGLGTAFFVFCAAADDKMRVPQRPHRTPKRRQS